jgi:hypothetical protein
MLQTEMLACDLRSGGLKSSLSAKIAENWRLEIRQAENGEVTTRDIYRKVPNISATQRPHAEQVGLPENYILQHGINLSMS